MSNIINYLRLISNYLGTTPPAGSTLVDGLQHYYKLDSELTDWVGSDDATISNMTYETGKINNGVQSTNTLARLTLASTDTNFSNNTCTWSMWVKVNSLGEKVFLDIAKTSHTVPYYANEIRMDAAGKIFTATNGGSNYLFYIPPTAPAFVIGEWTHIVVVFDGGKQTIYQNGISLGDSGDVPATTTFYGTPVLIGDMLNVSGQYSTGTVFDEIGYWDRELTADEINQLYFGSVGNQYPFSTASPLTASLQAYYKLDETSGTAVADALGLNNGTASNSNIFTSLTNGIINNSANFTGTEYITCTNDDGFNIGIGEFTISLWIKGIPTTVGSPVALAKSNGGANSATYGWLLASHSVGGMNGMSLIMATATDYFGFAIPNTLLTDKWNHFVYTVPSSANRTVNSNAKAYLNGVEITPNFWNVITNIAGSLSNTVNMIIGSQSDFLLPFIKPIDEVGFWDRALTATEINQLYFGSVGNQYPFSTANPLTGGLDTYFKFDETAGTTATDSINSYVMNYNGGTITTGKINNGVDVQTGDYPRCVSATPFAYSKTAPFTLSFWYKPSGTGTRVLCTNQQADVTRRGYELYLAGDVLYLNIFGNTTNNWWAYSFGNPGITTGNWYNIVITYDGSGLATGINTYVNNTLKTRTITQNSMSTYDFNSTNNFTFGAYYDNTAPALGVMDELASWSRALTATEITELYNATNGLQYPFGDEPVTPPVEPPITAGQVEYIVPGTFSWTAPAGVTSVSVVAVGAGGWSYGDVGTSTTFNPGNQGGNGGSLAYKNNITVVPGNSYTVVVGSGDRLVNSQDSYFINATTVKGGGDGGTVVGDGGGVGGSTPATNYSAGGGAGGYSGNGGNANGGGAPAGGGGGAGGAYLTTWRVQGRGGGVGIYGEGASGAGVGTYSEGLPGSGGSGGTYGAGAGGTSHRPIYNGTGDVAGSNGAVRIIWGDGRSFPSTLTTDQ